MRPPNYQFWIMREAKPKQYKRALYKQLSGAVDDNTGEQSYSWQVGHEYLSPISERFENQVRIIATANDVMPFDYVHFLIEVFWPIKYKKGKVVYPKAGRPDMSNVQKSVEDALQKRKVPRNLTSRLKLALEKVQESEYNPLIKTDKWEKEIERVELEIETIKELALVGAAVANDRDTHDIRTILRWVEPDGPKCVRVSIWEALPESYHTKRLTDWLRHNNK